MEFTNTMLEIAFRVQFVLPVSQLYVVSYSLQNKLDINLAWDDSIEMLDIQVKLHDFSV